MVKDPLKFGFHSGSVEQFTINMNSKISTIFKCPIFGIFSEEVLEVLEETIELTTENSVKTAEIGSRIELECRSNLKPPVAYAWSRDKNNQGIPMGATIRCEIFCFFSPLVPSKREKNILSLSQLVCISLYIFWGKCVYISIFEWWKCQMDFLT